MTRASLGIVSPAPTDLMAPPSIKMIWFLATAPVAGSIRLPARIASDCALSGLHSRKHKIRNRERILPLQSAVSGFPRPALSLWRANDFAILHHEVDLA